MKTQPIQLLPITRPSLLATLLGLALLGPLGPTVAAGADDLLVKTFDSELGPIAWQNWRSYVLGHDLVWDATQDADGNANSGSMYVTVDWPLASDPNWNDGWNDVQVAFNAGEFDSAGYLELEAYIKIDEANSSIAQNGNSYGVAGLYVTGGPSGGWHEVENFAVLPATDGWQRIHGSMSGIPAGTYGTVVVGLISTGGNSLTNTVKYWLDNVIITGATSVPTNGPTLSISEPPPAGLTCIASQPGGTWQRQMVSTANGNYSWNTSTAVGDITAYSMTIASAPDASYNGFASQMFLIPALGMGGGGARDDWGSANVVDLFVQTNPDGTATGHFQYKVNQPNSWNTSMEVDHDCATGPLGTWSLTFNNNTSVTITAPDNTSTNFTIPDIDAAVFVDPLFVSVGSQPNADANIGQSSTFSRFQVTGAAGSIDDTFETLDPGLWVNNAVDPAGISITSADARYSLSWSPANSDFGLQSSVGLGGTGVWTPFVPSADVITVGFEAGAAQTVVISESEVPGVDQGYWRLSYNPFSQLQVLLPGETAAPGTPTGKTGTPDSQKAGLRFPVTINAVASDWTLKSSVRDQVSLSSLTAPFSTLFYPSTNWLDDAIEQVRLSEGTATVWVEMFEPGMQSITASNITDSAIEPGTSSEFEVTF